ncbi:MAG TPA: hypothetical protein PKA95_06170 [Thermomicrobiales bacterium]|nr:hypothetical protein [Thermomicrobiales bacterium]
MISRPARLLPIVLILASLIVPTSLVTTAAPSPADAAAAMTAAGWLRGQIRADGGFAGFGDASDPGATADAIVALAAAGIHPATVTSGDKADPLTWLNTAAAGVEDPGVLAKVALAVAAAGQPLPDGLIARIEQSVDATTGRYGPSFYGHLLAVMALGASGADVPDAAVDAIPAAQAEDGSWGFTGDPAGAGDSNTTALAIQALARLDAAPDAISAGLDYLATLRDPNGAVAYDATSLAGGGDANSTALAIQGVVAAGKDPTAWQGGDLIAALRAFQNPSGAFQFQPAMPDDSLLATVQAIPALLGEALPIRPISAMSATGAAAAVQALPGCEVFAETGHNVCEPFRSFWHARGGLDAFGYPISEMYIRDGMLVQYFERARFEWHSDLAGTEWEILLGLLGVEAIEAEGVDTGPVGPSTATDCSFVENTRHNICGAMRSFWETHGGIPILGYPLTEANEVCDTGGCGTVQVFERARVVLRDGAFARELLGVGALDRALAR